jgi:hypothetical protein
MHKQSMEENIFASKKTERKFKCQIKSSVYLGAAASVTGGREVRGSPGECFAVSPATSKSLLMCLLRA